MNNFSDIEPLIYRPDYESIEEGEAEIIAELKKTFVQIAKTVADKEGHAYRAVHAKGQALLHGSLLVHDNPSLLSQGLFAEAREYRVIVRFSSPLPERLSDNVSSLRAVAIKVLDVTGDHAGGCPEHSTQDFLMVNTPTFVCADLKSVLTDTKLLATITGKMPRTKAVISTALRGIETVLETIGAGSNLLKTAGGQPKTHPLAETYFTQVPFMYGPYMAKFSLVPVSPSLLLLEPHLQNGDDAQREAINHFFNSNKAPTEWEFRVQLCTDIERMPIENPTVEWSTSSSPYMAVGKLALGPQVAWDDQHSVEREDQLFFNPWHALNSHRPLGAVNRARRIVMAASHDFRSAFNGCPIHESFNL